MKRVIMLVLTLALLCGTMPTAFAASSKEQAAANTLHDLGLFSGVGSNADGSPNYDLDRVPTRSEAITMLVRLLGKEAEAKSGNWKMPFTDVAEWAKPYVGYAYSNKLTSGTSETTFGGDVLVNATQYLTFVLRALGYESGVDFQWDKAWKLSDELGMTSGEYNESTNNSFLRGNIAEVSVHALPTMQKNQTATLADKLINDGVFTQSQFDKVLISYIGAGSEIVVQDRQTIVREVIDTEKNQTGYIKSKNSRVFHYMWCGEVENIKEKNKVPYPDATREDMINLGFRPCQVCNP